MNWNWLGEPIGSWWFYLTLLAFLLMCGVFALPIMAGIACAVDDHRAKKQRNAK
jgi:hypothetical protein